MFKMQDVRLPDARKLLLAIVAVAVMITVPFAIMQSDSSDATPVDGTHYFYNELTSAEARQIYDAAVNDYSVSLGEYPDKHPLKGQPALVTTFPVPLHPGDNIDDVQTNYAAAFKEVMPFFANEVVTYFWFGNYWTYEFVEVSYNPSTHEISDSGNPHIQFNVYSNVTGYGTTTAQINHSLDELRAAIHDTPLADKTTRYATVKSIHDAVCKMLKYDKTVPEGENCRNTYTAMLGSNIVVCEGYAKTFKALCDENGVPCIIVTGQGVDKNGKAEGHMWNYVQMDNDKWYLVDCTWDDQSALDYHYFLAGSNSDGFNMKVSADHTIDPTKYLVVTLPALNESAFVNDKFTVTFVDYDGTVLQQDGNLAFDADFPDAPADPAYTNAAIGTFVFDKWDQTLPEKVTGNVLIKAEYTITYKEYTITFKLNNGQSDVVRTLHYGDKVIAPVPEKEGVGDYVYKFSKWTPIVKDAITDIADDGRTYSASYSCICSINRNADAGFELTPEIKTSLGDADSLSVSLTNGSVVVANFVFNKTAANALVAGETLSVKKIDISALDEAVRDTLKGATIWNIDFGANNSVFSAGKAVVSLHYNKSITDYIGMDFYYVNGDTLEKLTYNYDTESNCIVFETNHFSDYAVQNSLANVNWAEYYPVFIIIAVALALFAVIYKFS